MTSAVVTLIVGLVLFALGLLIVTIRSPRPFTIFILGLSMFAMLVPVYKMGEGHPRNKKWLDANEVYKVVGSFSAGKSYILALRKVGAGEDDFVIYGFSKPQELTSKFVIVTGPVDNRQLKPFPVEPTAPTTQPAAGPPDKK